MKARAGLGTTRFPAGSWEASSFASALCGVSPRFKVQEWCLGPYG
ncbi:hypothetical protein GCM10011389_14330 [Pontibacillus salipaludis]|uniref:Uncharacterized protein n=1 Tax=Pontibacillus salipaludis TaxID=1697394 RepID=A0ABQ1Q050_9BACI|nr:hypothetical protein GCM10011389_14330 [Pontibacillus salipaludis]